MIDLKKLIKNKNIKKRLNNKKKSKTNILKQKVTSKKILKKSNASYKVPDRQVENVWHDENRFFRGMLKDEL